MVTPKISFTESKGEIVLTGELTRASLPSALKQSAIVQLLKNAQSTVYFDLSKVSRVDTAGLAWLIHSLGQLKQRDIRLELRNTPEQLQNLMELGQVTTLFE
ncbi:STAS domain-containing protein [Pseudoalteromonas sp. McH1-7]|uniref:STAS domain-containing protein n=1 Tax=Pseudoalteromonas TaxID=53246 RepID=UPI000F64EE91|nr:MULTISPECIES: STAS domain-containing protein [Pseudoalteromonas]MDW7550470.1 STAS domain-containing protein [Pseudoalteromonas peptidolytica]NLR16628.1 STAS domain-containing protein [Pseudoalteromonas peptidolytica]NUZ11815.1 STAS domain-containing protein [Pseudoalteromonas sp. McH1-7]RRS09920.1 anti-sigma factor antagonist [Pseudoalteromonas sp. J010]RXF03691.1 anti-sigma factor antagonist [Pseudoalteromonas sp. PS5]